MNRFISLVLTCVLMLSAVVAYVQPAAATTDENTSEVATETTPETTPEADVDMATSSEMIALLKFEEGFCKYPVWDYSQYTVGYGTRCPDDMLSTYLSRGITEAEAENLLRNHLANTEWLINTKLIDKYGLTLTQGQFDALVSFSYNMGSGWITNTSQNIHQKVASGATGNEIIDALSRWCKAGGQVKSFLVRRRLSEAYMYLEGQYAHTPPDYYCYVLYNGNGGSTGQSVQGYDANLAGPPTGTATYGSYTFAGWYTSPVGGIKVEALTQEYDGATLYAHWAEVEYEEPEMLDEPVNVTVTTNNVNLRKGPGTNYAIIGSADTGDQFEILQVQEGGSYLWGHYTGGGWIALQYTNFDSLTSEEDPEPSEPTDPDASEPEVTEPEPTEPETTKPEPTEPEITEPEATKPATVSGTVNADPYLCVRKGPGTGYPTVNTLRTGARVEITEQKTVGSMIWGKIADGWISMSYVTLDKDVEPDVDTGTQTPVGQTGTVTCSMLNVRSGAGVSYGIAGYYYKNDTVTITEQKTVGTTTWGKTSKGWVSMDYIALKTESDTGSGSPDEDEVTELTGTVVSNDVLRIRNGAGTAYGVVGYLNPNTKVTILEQKTVGATTWGRISKGWISMDYIKLDSNGDTPDDTLPDDEFEEEEPTTVVKTVNVSCLCVRSGAGTNNSVVSYLYKGSKVTVTETKTVGSALWGKIASGWICLDYTV